MIDERAYLRNLGDGDANCIIAVLFRVASLLDFSQKLSKARFPADSTTDAFAIGHAGSFGRKRIS